MARGPRLAPKNLPYALLADWNAHVEARRRVFEIEGLLGRATAAARRAFRDALRAELAGGAVSSPPASRRAPRRFIDFSQPPDSDDPDGMVGE